jgi:Protein of unknown function DUF72
MASQRVRIGCSGWSYDDWRGGLYPDGLPQRRAVARFWEPLESLRRGRRLGPVLWQLPENFHRDDDLLAAALGELPRAGHCFEFRHPPRSRRQLFRGGARWLATPDRRLALAATCVRLPQQRLGGLCPRQRALPEAGLVGKRKGVTIGGREARLTPRLADPQACPPEHLGCTACLGLPSTGARRRRRSRSRPRDSGPHLCMRSSDSAWTPRSCRRGWAGA